MLELEGCDRIVRNALRASTALAALVGERVFLEAAPQGAAFPYVVFNLQAATDRNMGSVRVIVEPVYGVRAVAVGDSFAAGCAIMDACDLALADVRAESSGVRVEGLIRQGQARYVEHDEGRRINHVLGIYRAFVYRSRPVVGGGEPPPNDEEILEL